MGGKEYDVKAICFSKEDLLRTVRDSGSKFFSPENMKFHGSRLCEVRPGGDYTFFVTSEKDRFQLYRNYYVRRWDGENVKTVGLDGNVGIGAHAGNSFYKTRDEAVRTMVRFTKDPNICLKRDKS